MLLRAGAHGVGLPASTSGRRAPPVCIRPPRVNRIAVVRGSTAQDPSQEEQPVEDGLTPEEDFVVPGGANDSLSSNTQLGKAVRSASDELEHLGNLEAEVVEEAFDLLKSFGIKLQKPSDVKKATQDDQSEK